MSRSFLRLGYIAVLNIVRFIQNGRASTFAPLLGGIASNPWDGCKLVLVRVKALPGENDY
jgi:hypothetical protein